MCCVHLQKVYSLLYTYVLLDTGTYVLDTSSIRTSTQVGTKYRTAVQLQL